jgi:hypothetical protein
MPVLLPDSGVASTGFCAPFANPVQPIGAPNSTPASAAATSSAPRVVTAKAPAPQSPNAPIILYQNRLTTASVAVTGGSGGQLVLSPNTFDRWNFSGSQSITFTLPSSTPVDAIGVGAHNLAGRTITADYSTTTDGAFVPFSSASAQTDNLPALFLNPTVNVRRIRITVSGSGAGFIGVIYAGLKLQMPHPIYGGHSPLPLNAVTDYFNNRSESGEWIGRQIRRRGFETSVELPRLKPDWYRANFQPFVDSAKENPFFFAWRPVSYPSEVGYCWTDGDIRASNIGGGRPELSVTLSLKAHG